MKKTEELEDKYAKNAVSFKSNTAHHVEDAKQN
jgi:hypothetical protein